MAKTVMFTDRTVPWMQLGKIESGAKSAAEAAVLGGLDFEVEKMPLAFGVQNDLPESEVLTYTPIPDRNAIVRTDTREWLGIMSKDYPLLQYSEAFDFMDQIGPEFVAAGSLQGGKQGFMVVRAPESFKVLGDEDKHELFAVLRTSHDGSRAIEVMVMPLRQRCMNQLTLQSFSSGVPHRWAIKHTSSMHKKLEDAHKSMANLTKYAAAFEKTADKLATLKITNETAENVLKAVLPDRPKRDDQITKIIDTWHTAETVGFDWTGWGLLNAVSEHFDWQRSGGSPQSRFVGALQGSTHSTLNRVAGRLLSRV